MTPTTPSGTRTRSMVMPFGCVQASVTLPTGSGSSRTTSRPSAIASMRLSFSSSRSRNEPVSPVALPSFMSSALAERISDLPERIAAAIAESARFFCSAGASASTRAAAFASRPIAFIAAAMSEGFSVVLSEAAMAT